MNPFKTLSRPLLTLLFCVLSGLAFSGLLAPAAASSVTVSPTTLQLRPGERAAQLTLINTGNQEVTFDLNLFSWAQNEGEDLLTSTQAVVVAPNFVTLKPGQSQTVRLVRLGNPPLNEAAYRLLATERAAPGIGGVSTRLQLSVPLFDGPKTTTPTGTALQVSLTADGTLSLQNVSSEHLRLSSLELRVNDAWTAAPIIYLLAGQRRILDVTNVQELRFSSNGGTAESVRVR